MWITYGCFWTVQIWQEYLPFSESEGFILWLIHFHWTFVLIKFNSTLQEVHPFGPRKHVSFPWVAVFQEWIIPGSIPCGVTIPARKPAPVCAPLPGLHFISCQEPASAWVFQLLLGHIHLPCHRVLYDLHGYLLHWDSSCTSRHNLLCHGLLSGLLGNLCSSTWSTPLPSLLVLVFAPSLTFAHSCSSAFLQTFPQSCHQHCWWPWLWMAGTGSFWQGAAAHRRLA